MLAPGDAWHGFGDLGARYCMLDPIKVTTLTPGVAREGKLEERGIPAAIVTAFLDTRGIVVEKTEPYSILTLFSVGITQGKVGVAGRGLHALQGALRPNAPLAEALPELAADQPGALRRAGPARPGRGDARGDPRSTASSSNLDGAFSNLPEPVLTPRETFARLVQGEVEQVPAAKLEGRILAVQVVPVSAGHPAPDARRALRAGDARGR